MNNKYWDSLWINADIATMQAGVRPYGLINNGGIAVKDGRIAWVGPLEALTAAPHALAQEVHDVAGHCITPGFIDCHTHVVYAGNRAHEFNLRLQGKSYAEIAKAGGGILATVREVRNATEEDLLQQSLPRVQALMAEGVTIIEIKSGYGLNLETELKLLRVAKKIGEILPIVVKTTFLGAHALPAEFQGRADDYIDLVCNTWVPAVAAERLADSVDVFCDTIGFGPAQTERVFASAAQYGLAIKCHAEQLSSSGGAQLAARYRAVSVDHLEFLTETGVAALLEAGTVAVLLPGAYYFLAEKKVPPVSLLRQYGVPMAIASDCNPGTSPITSILFILNSACILFGLTPEEALAGVTRHAARALMVDGEYGTLEAGKIADFLLWKVSHPEELVYRIGLNVLEKRVNG